MVRLPVFIRDLQLHTSVRSAFRLTMKVYQSIQPVLLARNEHREKDYAQVFERRDGAHAHKDRQV